MTIIIAPTDQANIKVLIARKGFSQREFAERINISHSYLSQLLNGKRHPSPSIAKKIAMGLDQEIEDIFFIKMVTNDSDLVGAR